MHQATLSAAFTAGRVKEGTSTYGFGWNVEEKEGRKFVWHQGATGGYRALIERRLEEKISGHEFVVRNYTLKDLPRFSSSLG